jgi:Predicted membrane protein
MLSKSFLTDQRFLILAIVGLLPMVIMNMPLGGVLLFYEVSLYFSIIWGLFFYTCFKTQQVSLKTTLSVFFLTQILVFTLWDFTGLPNLNPFYALVETSFPINILGFVFGVGLTEELVKLLPLIFILRRTKEPLIPQTMVFYGLMSGIAFGVYEGVGYQITVNAEQTYDVSFFLNIARLTSLPFLHACWCGIAGYFLAFAHLYPKYRRGLYALAISVPVIIHGLYDSFSNFWGVSLIMVFIGLMLLMVYLKHGVNYQSKLRQ